LQGEPHSSIGGLVRLMTEASIAADSDPSRVPAWKMGVEMIRRADESRSEEVTLKCLAAAAECFSAAAGSRRTEVGLLQMQES
jgi:hypothetical protein